MASGIFSHWACVLNWSGDSLVDWPPLIDPPIQDIDRKVENSSPICNALALLSNWYHVVGCFIVLLLRHGRPLAVFFTVPTVVVNALYGVLRGRLLPHIVKERRERLPPSAANSNAPTAIAMVTFVLFIITSIFHISPCVVFGGSIHPMRSIPVCNSFAVEAPATFYTTPNKVCSYGFVGISTITPAKPEVPVFLFADKFKCKKSGKPPICQINPPHYLTSNYIVSWISTSILPGDIKRNRFLYFNNGGVF